MPLIPLFSVTNINSTTIRITDISTGSDFTITERRVYLQVAGGGFLVPQGTVTDYIIWPIDEINIDLSVFTQDTSVDIKVQWLNAMNQIVYQKIKLYGFDFNEKTFMYNLTTLQEANPSIASDTNYYNNKANLWVQIISAQNVIDFGMDITKAQNCYNRGTYLIDNQNLFF